MHVISHFKFMGWNSLGWFELTVTWRVSLLLNCLLEVEQTLISKTRD